MSPNLFAQNGLATTVGGEVLAEIHAPQFSAALNLAQAMRSLRDLAVRYAIAPVLTIDEIRRANLIALIDEIGSARALGDLAAISPSMISQWKTGAPDSKTGKPRQLSSDTCRRLEKAGKKPRGWMDTHHSDAGAHSGGPATPLAQQLSLIQPMIEPRTIPWESILSEPLPALFRAVIPDDAMGAEYPRGCTVNFSTTEGPPRARDLVLVRDADGGVHFREYQTGRGGRWQAVALMSGYQALDSQTDGLQVLAISMGRWGRRG